MSELYTYQVARIRCHELKLLSRQDMDLLLSCDSFDACLRVLFDKGIGTGEETSTDQLLQVENQKLWALMQELLKGDMSAFDVLLYPTDYNNLKAAIKAAVTDGAPANIFKAGGTVDPAIFEKAVKDNDFSKLPSDMIAPAKAAYQTLLQTHDGQLCDILLDRACLCAIAAAGDQSDDALIKAYAETTVAIANIKIALRCQRTKKTIAFVKDALVPCQTLNVSALATACVKTEDDLFAVLSSSKYSDCVELLKESNSAFEKWCDDAVMQLVKKQKTNPFTIGPLVAFVIARQTELNAVKIILSGKLNQIPDQMIKERLRDMYV